MVDKSALVKYNNKVRTRAFRRFGAPLFNKNLRRTL